MNLGFGAMGTSVFTLILPLLIGAIGLGYTYLIWFALQLCVVVFIATVMRNPPFLQCSLEARKKNVKVLLKKKKKKK
jgi:nitrate/nitrite transporter NarK